VSEQEQNMKKQMVEWARRPPQLDAESARTAVLSRLRAGSSSPGPKLLVPAAVALLLFVATLFHPAPRGVSPRLTRVDLAPATERLAGPMMVYRLQSGATLYVVLSTTADAAGVQSTVGKDGKG
jgi:hypothetical protein